MEDLIIKDAANKDFQYLFSIGDQPKHILLMSTLQTGLKAKPTFRVL